ncbi:hypothetical protein [Blastochloris viridis]|uniref:DUF304 domain-containing protein n=1 Tax=Blastochloris viridis TaxID=1079 RepID=A0A0H5BNM6_BLAVI|nr:hypothetical protein [Blastochloris viridis]ALK08765.1 hypothetical protein BVIR_974 [Blastochloris viridis]BAR97938.1 hypothetical protein BV133_345 [Blastochloris viridis]CUU41426.1 hypothetical protein BVIRIDIS_04170 [Blastochloris viridis]
MAVVVPFPAPKTPSVGNRAAAARLFDHLEPGERLIWADRPDAWAVVRDRGFMVPLWIGAIAVPLGAVLALAAGSGPAYYAGLALLVGAVVIASAAFGFWRRANETVYGLTDRHILVLRDGAIPRLSATPADRIAWIDVVRQRDGSGAVTLTIVDGSNSGTELVLGGLADPGDVARRVVHAYQFDAPHLV